MFGLGRKVPKYSVIDTSLALTTEDTVTCFCRSVSSSTSFISFYSYAFFPKFLIAHAMSLEPTTFLLWKLLSSTSVQLRFIKLVCSLEFVVLNDYTHSWRLAQWRFFHGIPLAWPPVVPFLLAHWWRLVQHQLNVSRNYIFSAFFVTSILCHSRYALFCYFYWLFIAYHHAQTTTRQWHTSRRIKTPSSRATDERSLVLVASDCYVIPSTYTPIRYCEAHAHVCS